MNSSQVVIWVMIGLDGLVVLALIWWGVWATWFDDRLRVIIFNSKYGLSIHKVKVKNDNQFSLGDHTYTVDKKAIYRRFLKIPYSLYFENIPNPVLIDKPSKGDSKKISIKYTAQELHRLLEVNYTMNLIKPPTNIRKLVIGTTIAIIIGAIILIILQVTGLFDVTQFMTGLSGGGTK